MNNRTKYAGIYPAFYACYEESGAISTERTRRLASHLIGRGVQGRYVEGSSGEGIYHSVEERKQVLEAVMGEAAGRVRVIAHVAANHTADSMELARHAQSLGVDAIAAIPPIYFHLPDHAIADYWNAISSAAPETDFFIYNIPQLAGVALSPALLKRMLDNPRVVGVKNSSMPVYDIQKFYAAGGEDFVVFNGPDEQFVSGRVIGASGGIGGTYAPMPELFLAMNRLVEAGRMEEARRIQFQVNGIIELACSGHGNMYAIFKEVLRLQGVEIGSVRPPLTPLAETDRPIAAECASRIAAAVQALPEI